MRAMNSKFVSGMATLLLCMGGTGACAQDTSLEAFEKSFFAPLQISSFSLDPERLGRLTTEQQRQLLIARSITGEFFRALEDVNGDPLRFMTAEYTRRALDRLSLRQTLVSEETTILQVAIRDYSFSDDARTIKLDLYVTAFSEGTFATSEARCMLQRSKSTWQIVDVAVGP
jgi:hypothetical protein